jgi:cytochrome oxidase Cu insertion factor (SCO1/SenC/PrrC family)
MRALGVLLAVVALAAAACGGGTSTQGTSPETTTTTTEPPPADGKQRPQAPPIDGTTLDGETVSLADFRGKPVLVNVWSSW